LTDNTFATHPGYRRSRPSDHQVSQLV